MQSRIVCHNGNRFFEINGRRYIPAAARSFRPTPANITLFYRNGIRLFQVQCSGIKNTLGIPYSLFGGCWVGDHQYDFSALDRQMELYQKFAPEGYFMPMVVLDMPEWWREQHQCEVDSFVHLSEASLIPEWKEEAADYLKAFLRHCEARWGERVFAYSFSAGRSTEWFDNYSDHPRKVAAYRAEVGDPHAPVPTLEELRAEENPDLYGNDTPAYQYLKFCSRLIPNLINEFTAAAQEVLQRSKPLGIFFGYTCLPPQWQNQRGTNGYEAVWKNPDIDLLFSPAEYRKSRLPEGVSTYQYTVDSLPLHDKLYLHEIDHRTHLACYPMENGQFLACDYQTEEETIRILRRELCAAAAKDGALWWFDFMGGYYASPGLEAELQREMQILERIYEKPHRSVAEIAVFADPMSFLHMKDTGHFTLDLVAYNRDSLNECGAPYDYYNLKDLPRVPVEQYKMFVILNGLEMEEETKAFIRERLGDKRVVWLYAPNHFSGGSGEVCGIALQPAPATAQKVVYGGEEFGFTQPVSPMFAPAEGEIFARYTDGTPACARKGNEVYIATGNLPPALWRDLAREAGVHIYVEKGGALYIDSRFIARQTMQEAEPELVLPFDCVLEELFDGGIYETKNRRLRYAAPHGETKLFLIKERK